MMESEFSPDLRYSKDDIKYSRIDKEYRTTKFDPTAKPPVVPDFGRVNKVSPMDYELTKKQKAIEHIRQKQIDAIHYKNRKTRSPLRYSDVEVQSTMRT
jgi:hypothetical protein